MSKLRTAVRVCGTKIFGASESQAACMLAQRLPVRTVVCLRRDLPVWWAQKRREHPDVRFCHHPVPSVFDGEMESALGRVLRRLLPDADTPVLVFCLRGRNRTGVLAGALRYGVTGSWRAALAEYRRRAGARARVAEEAVLRALCEQDTR